MTCEPCLSRRTVLTAAGTLGAAALLTACGGPGAEPAPLAQSTRAADDPVITDLAALKAAGAVAFTSGTGKAVAVMVGEDVVAFSSTCTHEGCQVAWDAGKKLLACPCHGSAFDPAAGAKVVAGPAPRPLARVPVVVDTAAGVVRRG
ncbi:MAG: Twin-arginine translocation pathway signal [Frankiales bacterium]|jgi:Rieske Fe-S protein|nr:Twin-arginine translocation pathway signal [Frankiales bacterium]